MKKKGSGNSTKKYFARRMEFVELIDSAMKNPRHAAILRSRLRGDSLIILAEEYQVTPTRIAQIEKQGLKKMKKFTKLL